MVTEYKCSQRHVTCILLHYYMNIFIQFFVAFGLTIFVVSCLYSLINIYIKFMYMLWFFIWILKAQLNTNKKNNIILKEKYVYRKIESNNFSYCYSLFLSYIHIYLYFSCEKDVWIESNIWIIGKNETLEFYKCFQLFDHKVFFWYIYLGWILNKFIALFLSVLELPFRRMWVKVRIKWIEYI